LNFFLSQPLRWAAFALGGAVKVEGEAGEQQQRGENDEDADGAFDAAKPGAKLGR
jgi:hypothetical protein